MPLEILESSVRYQSLTKLLEIAVDLADTQNLRKKQEEINTGFKIFLRLQALDYGDYLTKDERDQICYCLMELAGITDLPVAPVLGNVEPPTIFVGIKGDTGDPGQEGPEGGGVPFTYEDITQDTVVDSFAITESRGVDYRLAIYGEDGMRIQRIIAGWSADGAYYGDDGGDGPDEIYGDTSDVSISVVVNGLTVQLFATVTPGSTWTVSGSRIYIPNNGSGIVTPTTLSDGKVWVGNASNTPTAVTISGDISITNSGVSSITANSIVNADINSSAAIAQSKLAALTASRIAVTDSNGFLTTGTPTVTEVNYLSGTTSNLQTQLDSKISSASGAISTVVSTNLTPSYTVVSNPAGKIAVSSTNTTELGYVQGVTSPIQTQFTGVATSLGLKANKAQSAWQTITLNAADGYISGSRTAQYRTDEFGRVNLRGIISIGGSPPVGDHAVSGAAAVPIPSQRYDMSNVNSALTSVASCYVDTNGTIRAATGTAWGGTLILDGLSYWVS